MAKRDYKGRLELKSEMELKMAEVLEAKGVDYVKVSEGLVVMVDEDYVVLRAVVKKSDYDLEDAVSEYEDKLAKADERAKAKEEKAKAKAKAKAEKSE